MIKLFFNILFSVISGFVTIVTSPINLLLNGVFPDFSHMISMFNNVVTNYIGGLLGYFSTILPTNTRSMVLIYLGLLITFYTITITAHFILKTIEIVKNVKFW